MTASIWSPGDSTEVVDNNIFIQEGVGAVERTVTSKLRDIVSVKDFGAIGDGITDETAAFQLAVNAIQAAGGGTVYVPNGTYRITNQVLITASNVAIEGSGPGCILDLSNLIYFTNANSLDIDFTSASYYRRAAFAARGTFVKEVRVDTATLPILENQAVITLVPGGTSGLQVGDSIFLRSKQHWYGVGERYTISKIIDIVGNTVTLMEGAVHQFDATGVVRNWVTDYDPPYTEWGGYYTWNPTATDVRLIVWRPIKNFSVTGFNAIGGGMEFTAAGVGPGLDGVTPHTITESTVTNNGTGQCFVHMHYVEGATISRNKMSDFRGVCIIGMYSSEVSIKDNLFYGLPDDDTIIVGGVNSSWYAMFMSQGKDILASGNSFYRMRHGCDGAEVFNFTQVNNSAYRTFLAAFGSHQEVYQLVISNNVAYNCYALASLRCKDAVVTGNAVYGSVSAAQPLWGNSGVTTLAQTQDSDDGGVFVISGNSFIINAAVGGGVIYLGCALKQCTISNNAITISSGLGIQLQGASVVNTTLSNNNISIIKPDEEEYPGKGPTTGNSMGIYINPLTDSSGYAPYFNVGTLTANYKNLAIVGNNIKGYGGGTESAGTGHGIFIKGTSQSGAPLSNLLVSGNIGEAQLEDSSYFIRFASGGYFGKGVVVTNNTADGDSTTVVGWSTDVEYQFYEAPIVEGNVGKADSDKSGRMVDVWGGTARDCTTYIKGAILERQQGNPGAGNRYIVTTSGTMGTLATITATTVAGNPNVTVVGNGLGDSYISPGQFISIAGANTGARVIAVSTDYATITLDANASALVSGAAVTRYAPAFRPLSTIGGDLIYIRTNSTAFTAEVGTSYFLGGGTTVTVTLPTAPTEGDVVAFTVINDRVDTIVARASGVLLQGVDEDMVLDSELAAVRFRYTGSYAGWRIVK